MKTTVMLSAALCASVLLAPASFAEKVLSGQVCSEQVEKLSNQINWYKNLSKAESAAQEQNKLIFWIHMVGKIDGAT